MLKIVETNLNLRVEKGAHRLKYSLTKEVAEKQLSIKADIYANVEYMQCNDNEYIEKFKEAGYNIYTSVDDKTFRGILYAIKTEYEVQEIASLKKPHMFHIQIGKGKNCIELITVRLLVAGSDDTDFLSRKIQWNTIMEYLDNIENKENVIITGDWNHGVIANSYNKFQARRYFNYQMIVNSLRERNIELFPIPGFSYRGYMKIDHIASGLGIKIRKAEYQEIFTEGSIIGVPDHKVIFSELDFA